MKKYHRVRDHCYGADKYRGAAHSICNLKYCTPKEVLMFLVMDQTMIASLS